jgi:hypothetical protein
MLKVKKKKKESDPATCPGGARGERRNSSYSFLTSTLNGGEWSASRPGCALPPPGTHWIGDWVGPRASLDAEAGWKILCLWQGSNPGHPVCSQTLYWLSYPGSYKMLNWQFINFTMMMTISLLGKFCAMLASLSTCCRRRKSLDKNPTSLVLMCVLAKWVEKQNTTRSNTSCFQNPELCGR